MSYTQLVASPAQWACELTRHRDFLKALGIDARDLAPMLWTGDDDARAAEGLLAEAQIDPGHAVALFAGVAHKVRQYDGFGQALSRICRQRGLSIITLGSASDAAFNGSTLRGVDATHVDFSARTTLRVAAEVLRRCRIAVGVETGLAHVACAVGTTNVILLGGGHFGRFMPYSPLTRVACLPLECFGCNWLCKYDRAHCVADVEAAVLEAAIEDALDRPAAKPRVFVQDQSWWRDAPGRPRWQWSDQRLPAEKVEVLAVSAGANSSVQVAPVS
jgi:ADP-heptose:LPS heptosyltransferase